MKLLAGAALLSLFVLPVASSAHPADDKWNLHNEYEKERVEKCYAEFVTAMECAVGGFRDIPPG